VTLLNEDINPPLPSLASAPLKKFKSTKEQESGSAEVQKQ